MKFSKTGYWVDGRVYRIRTFLPSYFHPHYKVIDDSYFRSNYVLIFNIKINRYLVYRRYTHKINFGIKEFDDAIKPLYGYFVHMLTLEGINKSYREPGYWVERQLREMDATHGGMLGVAQTVKTIQNSLEAPDAHELDQSYKMQELQREMDTEIDKIRRGLTHGGERVHFSKKIKRRINIFVGARTGKVLGCKVTEHSSVNKSTEHLPQPLL